MFICKAYAKKMYEWSYAKKNVCMVICKENVCMYVHMKEKCMYVCSYAYAKKMYVHIYDDMFI